MYFSCEIHNFLQYIVEFIFDGITTLLYLLYFLVKPIAIFVFKSSGIEIDGNNAWDIKVKDNRFYGLIVAKGVTGFFDAYIEGYIVCDDLEETFMKVMVGPRFLFSIERYHPYRLLKYFIHTYFDALTPESIRKTTEKHYESHAERIKEYFDSTGQYSTMLLYDLKEVEDASPEGIEHLMDEGAFRSREQIARKLKLEPGMKVLDIGCGFGGLAKHLAELYKVQVTGVTVCRVMAEHATEVCKGLPVKIVMKDYRELTGEFDRIVSIEMFEHVGEIHFRDYFKKVNTLLTDDGIFVFQAHHWGPDYIMSYSPMLERSLQMYCYFPRLEEIAIQTKGLLIIDNIQNLGHCFGVTCKAVLKNVTSKIEQFMKNSSESTFRRLYIYGCLAEAAGLSGKDLVYQIVLSKNGFQYAYQ